MTDQGVKATAAARPVRAQQRGLDGSERATPFACRPASALRVDRLGNHDGRAGRRTQRREGGRGEPPCDPPAAPSPVGVSEVGRPETNRPVEAG